MEHWWNESDRKTGILAEKPATVTVFHYRPHINCTGIEPGLPQRQDGEYPPEQRPLEIRQRKDKK
jgi:hypothetical protein